MRISTIQHTSFLILLALVTVAFLVLIRDFLQPLFWAAVFAILFRRIQDKAVHWFGGRRSIAAVLTISIIVFLVIVPFFFVAMAVAREAVALYGRISEGNFLADAFKYLEQNIPPISGYMERFGVDLQKMQERLSGAAVSVSGFLAGKMVNIGQVTAVFVVDSLLMLYILFFFLRDGDRMVNALIRALPFGDMRERRLFRKFAEVSRETVKGTLVVGLVQGSIGGLLFWILGIGAPVFWGVIMAILSLLPAVGTAMIWGPAAIILIVRGNTWKGIILIIAGTFIIGLVDNVLRPILVGRGTRMPDFLVLIATLGGLTAFGVSGFVLGPIVAALFLTMWAMFAEEYARVPDPGRTKISLPGEDHVTIAPPGERG